MTAAVPRVVVSHGSVQRRGFVLARSGLLSSHTPEFGTVSIPKSLPRGLGFPGWLRLIIGYGMGAEG